MKEHVPKATHTFLPAPFCKIYRFLGFLLLWPNTPYHPRPSMCIHFGCSDLSSLADVFFEEAMTAVSEAAVSHIRLTFYFLSRSVCE